MSPPELRSDWKKSPTCTALEEPDLVSIAAKDGKLLGARLPDTEALQQMYVKAQLYKQGGDHMSSIIYASMALWSYRAQVKSEKDLDEDVQEMFLGIIRNGRTKLMEQFKKQSDEQDDMQEFTPEKEKDMVDKVTNEPLSFKNLSGMTVEKEALKEQFLYPNMFKFLFYGDVNNVLLYGPPGTGKTFIAKALVNEFMGEVDAQGNRPLDMLMFIAAGNSLRSKWEGGTEKNIASLFQASETFAEKHKKGQKPCKSLIFLDEVESLAKSRALEPQNSRSVTTLLQQIDGPIPLKHTLVMAATNYPWQLDSAFLRRFTSKVFVDVPDFSDRAELLCSILLKKLMTHNDKLIRLLRLTPDTHSEYNDDVSTKFMEHFVEYKKHFQSDNTTVKVFVPELDKVVNYDIPNDPEHRIWKQYENSLEQHKAQRNRVVKAQLNFLRVYMEENAETEYTTKDGTSTKQNFADWCRSTKIFNDEKVSKEDLSAEKIPLRTYIRLFAKRMKNSKLKEVYRDEWGIGPNSNLGHFEEVCILCHYVAEITGPNPLLKVILDNVPEGGMPDIIPQKRVSHLSNSIFGYSNSDVDKVVGKLYQELASKIIRSFVNAQHTCDDATKPETTCRGKISFQTQAAPFQRYKTMQNLDGNDTFQVQYGEGVYNAYVTIDPVLFQRALHGYATTTGNLQVMFDYYCFQSNQSDEEPGCKYEMMKRINHLRSNPKKTAEASDPTNAEAKDRTTASGGYETD